MKTETRALRKTRRGTVQPPCGGKHPWRGTALVGKVGNDAFGSFLKDTLQCLRVSVEGLAVSETVHTTLAFVQLDERGDRSFSFYRNSGADMMLEMCDIKNASRVVNDCRILHFGSVSLTDEPARSPTLQAVLSAKEHGRIVSYDPNFRPPLWSSPATAKERISKGARRYRKVCKRCRLYDNDKKRCDPRTAGYRGDSVAYGDGALAEPLIQPGRPCSLYRLFGQKFGLTSFILFRRNRYVSG